MKRQLIALIVMLGIGLQGSVAAFAGITPLMQPDCESSSESRSDASHKSCCPGASRQLSCCVGVSAVAAAVPMMPRAVVWPGSAAPTSQFRTLIFSSRGDSPLIRPPIL